MDSYSVFFLIKVYAFRADISLDFKLDDFKLLLNKERQVVSK